MIKMLAIGTILKSNRMSIQQFLVTGIFSKKKFMIINFNWFRYLFIFGIWLLILKPYYFKNEWWIFCIKWQMWPKTANNKTHKILYYLIFILVWWGNGIAWETHPDLPVLVIHKNGICSSSKLFCIKNILERPST